MSRFDQAVSGALTILSTRGRVSLRALSHAFDLSDAALAALRDELVDVLEAAVERDGLLVASTSHAAAPPRADFPAEPRIQTRPERRQITVLSCDLAESTAMAQRLELEDLRDVLTAYQETCGEATAAAGGHMTGWRGDGVFVLFGYPRAGEDDAMRAVACGREILRRVAALDARFRHELGVEVAVRVGIHTGTAIVGGDTAVSGETPAFGETPNVAARVAGLAEPGTLAISERTARIVSGYFDLESLGDHELKGLARPLTLYRVAGPGAVRRRFDVSLHQGLSPLVDRELERDVLRAAVARAAAGEMRAVLIRGDAGIGKSRLLHEAQEDAGQDFQQLVLECSPYHSGTPLQPVLDALRRHWELAGSAHEQLDALRGALAAHPDIDGPRELALLALLFGLPAPPDAPELGSAGRQRHETLRTIAELVRGEARRGPLLLAVEDAHWIDPSTLELLDALLRGEPCGSLLLLLTARPEFVSPWDGTDGLCVLAVQRLDATGVRQLVGAVAASELLSATELQRIETSSDGVPLFVEEMTHALMEGLAGVRHDDIPTTLYGCLMARLDRDGDTLAVAQVGATIGREFGRDMLCEVCSLDAGVIDAGLCELLDVAVLDRVPGRELRYAFRHSLIQEAARGSMLRSARRLVHGRIADVVERSFPEIAAEHPEVLAQHLEDAGRTAEAVVAWMRAGHQAVGRSANAEAILRLERALALLEQLPDDDERARVELPLRVLSAVPLTLTRGWTAPAVEAHYQRARELCEHVTDARELVPTLVGLATYLLVSGQMPAARAMGERHVELALDARDPEHELEARLDLGNILVYSGHPREALGHFDRVGELYEPEHHHSHALIYGKDPGAIALVHRGLALWNLGRPDSARECMRRAGELVQAWPHPFSRAWVHIGHACLGTMLHDPELVAHHADAAITQSAVEGFQNWHAQATAYRGWALAVEGDVGGLELLDAGLEAWSMSGASLMVPLLSGLVAEGLAACDRLHDAIGAADEALVVARRTQELWREPELARLRAELGHRAGELPAAEAAAQVRASGVRAARRGAVGIELRCATTATQLTGAPGDEAWLRSCCDGLTEGLGTRDAIAARAVLDATGTIA